MDTTIARPPRWRPFTKRPTLLTIVGVLVAAIVATVVAVIPESHAREGVTMEHRDVEAYIKEGTENTCVIEAKAPVFATPGNTAAAVEFANAVTETAEAQGAIVIWGPDGGNQSDGRWMIDLRLQHEHQIEDAANCTTPAAVNAHRGRQTLELPSWARGMVASAAGLAVYLTVVFAVTAVFAFLAPEFAIYGELIGGCVGGFASTYVANYINRVPNDANLTASAVQCIAGAILNISLGSLKKQMVDAIRGHVDNGLETAMESGMRHGAGHHGEIAAEFASARSQFSVELDELASQVGD
jgi:hypothetical protein